MKEEQAKINPIEEQRKEALAHYERASNAIHHWSGFVQRAIETYNPESQSSALQNQDGGEEIIAFGKRCFYKGFDKSKNDDANCYTAWREEAQNLIATLSSNNPLPNQKGDVETKVNLSTAQELIEKAYYWKQRCEAAEKIIHPEASLQPINEKILSNLAGTQSSNDVNLEK